MHYLFYYLLMVILFTDGNPAATVTEPFTSQDECLAQGFKYQHEAYKDDTIDKFNWTCVPVDFDSFHDKEDTNPPDPTQKKS